MFRPSEPGGSVTSTVQGSGNTVATGNGAKVKVYHTLADCQKDLDDCQATVKGLHQLLAAKEETIAALKIAVGK